ncbi:hypothetical protein BDZ94DRAFT_945321 [Collybia nuda]|uniref:Uncharacterized protein n=1 Tax=Collybia nuda TaxID=64659 RepID=A0A9P5Y0N7_9AGAR|nr:hypothetical protein BDZ94DRAFT_945321 [Collybia nuda]
MYVLFYFSTLHGTYLCTQTTALPQTSFTFDYTAPPHAFPTPYSQTSLTTKQCIFPTPVWMRCRSTIRPFRMVSTMEDLIADFTLKLVVTEPSSKQLRENHQSSSILKLPWFAATYTLPPPAPHPAFIPTTICGTSASLPFSSISHPSMLASKSNSNIAYRKIAHPPKRMPKHRSIAHHEASPTTSQTLSSFTSSSSTSRPRSPSSSSSTSSNTSSTLTTPILSPISLPENAQLPISISGIDFQNVDDPFYDYPTTVPALDEIDLHSFSHATLPPKKLFQLDLETPASHTR